MIARKREASRFGQGVYAVPEAAQILKVSASKVRRWLDPKEGLIFRRTPGDDDVVTFLELMELHFVKMFRCERVSLQTIRKAAEAAKRRFDTEYPFAVKRFDTDGKTIFATLLREENEKVVVEDLRRGQYVFDQIMRPFFRKLEYSDSQEALRYWPMEPAGRVVLDPERRFGKPIDAETGVTTRAIFDAVNAGGGQDLIDVAEWLGIPLAAVERAVEFENSLTT